MASDLPLLQDLRRIALARGPEVLDLKNVRYPWPLALEDLEAWREAGAKLPSTDEQHRPYLSLRAAWDYLVDNDNTVLADLELDPPRDRIEGLLCDGDPDYMKIVRTSLVNAVTWQCRPSRPSLVYPWSRVLEHDFFVSFRWMGHGQEAPYPPWEHRNTPVWYLYLLHAHIASRYWGETDRFAPMFPILPWTTRKVNRAIGYDPTKDPVLSEMIYPLYFGRTRHRELDFSEMRPPSRAPRSVSSTRNTKRPRKKPEGEKNKKELKTKAGGDEGGKERWRAYERKPAR